MPQNIIIYAIFVVDAAADGRKLASWHWRLYHTTKNLYILGLQYYILHVYRAES